MKDWMRHKVVRISALVLLIAIGLIAVIIIVAQIYISSHKKELLTRINTQLSTLLKGDVKIAGLEVNAWSHFPNINIELQQVVITDSVYHRPVLDVKEVSTRIPLMSILRSKAVVRFVKVADGYVHLFTDSTGYTNKYLFTIKSPQQKDSITHKQLMIQEVELLNVNASLENAVKNKRYEVLFKRLNARLQQHDTLFQIDMRENVLVKGLGFNLERGSYLSGKAMEGRWKVTYNTRSQTISFPETRVNIEKHLYTLRGAFTLGDSSRFTLDITSQKVQYQQAASLVNQHIQQKLGLINFEKPLNVKVSLEGPLTSGTRPRVTVNADITDNILVTPVARFEACNFQAFFTNEVSDSLPRTDENSRLMLSRFSANWGGAVFKGDKVVLDNLQKPVLAFDVSSTCALQALDGKIGLQTLHFLNGTADVFLQFNGPVNLNTDATRYLSGKLVVHDGAVHYEPRNLTFSHCNGQLEFSPDEIHTTGMECNVGNNHFTVKLDGDDMHYLTADETEQKVSLSCEVHTGFLQLADFRSLFSKKKKQDKPAGRRMRPVTQVAGRFDNLLEKGTFRLKISADTMVLNHFSATELNGQVAFRHDNFELENVSVSHAGGTLSLRGNIQQLENGQHKATTHIMLNNVDVRRAFYAFDNFGLTGLTSANLRGRLSTTANLQLLLNENGDIVPNSMNGLVYFSLKDGELIKFEPLENIKNFVFRDKDLSHIQFAELKDSLVINNSEMTIHRMEIQSSVMTLYVEGLYSLRGNTDISIQIPLHNFLANHTGDLKNKGAHAKMGASIHLRARPDLKGNIKIGLDLFKKYRKQHKDNPL